ncbi:PREDICTED: arrestin homolog [Diuraphis noxia]|uniref:arrestin homolog n=1 Tax=Diuraphis noxia TaxID=143948 RepID=UPI000763AE87|nr:PREDICTED: arrestin homolog [Diuraphis noxia]
MTAAQQQSLDTTIAMSSEEHEDQEPSSSRDLSCIQDSLPGIAHRVFRKTAQNNKLCLYLGNRDVVVSNNSSTKIHGIVLVEPDLLRDTKKKVFGQITLTFRYGREDEEVMGLKFCNEAIMCLAQIYPPHENAQREQNTPLQEMLIQRLGSNAHAFSMEITHLAPPSVQLVPAKEYSGAPIGTSYDIRVYIAERADEKLQRKNIVKMGIKVVQMASAPPPPTPTPRSEQPKGWRQRGPQATSEKPFLLSDGKVTLEANLDKAIYTHGDPIHVNISVKNTSKKAVRRIKVFIVQQVDVCMFSNGKFKNTVASDECADVPIPGNGGSLEKEYLLYPIKARTKNWIALEDSLGSAVNKSEGTLSSTVVCVSPEDRNVFAIYVTYYVKVKLLIGAMGGQMSLKLPFTLMHTPSNTYPAECKDASCTSLGPCLMVDSKEAAMTSEEQCANNLAL